MSLSASGCFKIHRTKQGICSRVSETPIDEHNIILGFCEAERRAYKMFLVPVEHVSSGLHMPRLPKLKKIVGKPPAKRELT